MSYVDPPPEALTIGPQSLRAYLEASGNCEVFVVRKLVRGLDYSSFFSRYDATGRAPYHPALMVGLIAFALMRDVRSLRRIEAFARDSVSAWWLTGGACPDHASIGRFVARFGDLLKGHVFEQLTAEILKATGTCGTDLAGDGTTVASMASRFGLICEEAARERAAALREQMEELKPERSGSLREDLEQEAEKYERAAESARREVKRTGRNPTTRSVKVALADPEATLQKLKNGLPAPSYKPTILANEARIVVAHDVQSSSENNAVDGLCEQAKRVSQTDRLDCVRLDAGFFAGGVLKTLLDHDVDNPLVTDKAVAAGLRGPKAPPKRYAKAEFRYDLEADTYTCPAGQTLKLIKHRKVRRTKIYGGAPCDTCSLRPNCTNSKKGRQVARYEQDPVLEAMREVMANPLARADYAKRSAMVEPVFADLKQRQGFTRFLRAGLAKVRVEFALHVLAHNLLKYLSWRKRAQLALAGLNSLWRLRTLPTRCRCPGLLTLRADPRLLAAAWATTAGAA